MPNQDVHDCCLYSEAEFVNELEVLMGPMNYEGLNTSGIFKDAWTPSVLNGLEHI